MVFAKAKKVLRLCLLIGILLSLFGAYALGEASSPAEAYEWDAQTKALRISDASAMSLAELEAVLRSYPELERVEIRHSRLTAEEVLSLRAGFPKASVTCDFKFLDRD